MSETRKNEAGGFRNRLRTITLIVMLTLGVAGMSATAASASTPQVPMKAVAAGTVTQTSASTFTLTGIGVASPLGVFSYSGKVVVTSSDPKTGVITDTLTETLTMANGDTVKLLCNQVARPIGGGVLHGTDTWSVVGGTGRFSGATGSGTGDTFVDNFKTLAKVMTGTITPRS